jgi:hypothetical protein
MADKSTEKAQQQTAREATDAAARFRGAGTVKTADALQTPRAACRGFRLALATARTARRT